MSERESLGSRLGFLLLSAGCAIGIGNVWKFPYITGQYGGGIFVLIYLFFLIAMGVPLMTVEFSVGRASRKSVMRSYQVLEKPGQKWHYHGVAALIGNVLLMMFYTVVAGWMLHYFYLTLTGRLAGVNQAEVSQTFSTMTGNPSVMTFWTIVVVVLGFAICAIGLKNGVERITKVMMLALLALIVVLAVHSILLPGAGEGLRFYLVPDLGKMAEVGIGTILVAAMNQAFFTLSIGVGSMAIFGSYISRDRALPGEAVRVAVLDTFVALVSGLIIFPACSAFGVNAGSGPSLIFETLPNIFAHMKGGRVWGSLFFLFMAFAAMSTVIAVFENINSCVIDVTGWSRRKASLINGACMLVLSMPCVLGFNLLSGFNPLGAGTNIMDLEDFLVSNIILPLGALVYLLFCVSKKGWGWKNFQEEANTGKGLKLGNWMRPYMTYVLPVVILIVFIMGLVDKFF
ncbi:MAG: sodium-dependent transporter [Clostridia bacterium]|nr:sodium-dependent transporter [Clostridia bacterium]